MLAGMLLPLRLPMTLPLRVPVTLNSRWAVPRAALDNDAVTTVVTGEKDVDKEELFLRLNHLLNGFKRS